jgi:hypothetical protein
MAVEEAAASMVGMGGRGCPGLDLGLGLGLGRGVNLIVDVDMDFGGNG